MTPLTAGPGVQDPFISYFPTSAFNSTNIELLLPISEQLKPQELGPPRS